MKYRTGPGLNTRLSFVQCIENSFSVRLLSSRYIKETRFEQ